MPTRIDFLRSVSYFAGFSDQELSQIDQAVIERSFSRGQLLFLEGEQGEGLYLVKSGMVRVFKTSTEGREMVMLIARPGDTFNDAPAFDGGLNLVSASAAENTTVYMIPTATLMAVLGGCRAAAAIIRGLSSRLRHLTTVIEDLSFRSVSGRLAKLLLEQVTAGERTAPVPRLTQDEMAAMVGSVRDVIGRVLRSLEKEGAIRIEGHRIMVTNRDLLQSMV
jgi:CRP-like cAMP-binding protein